jgi:hypothetical protein
MNWTLKDGGRNGTGQRRQDDGKRRLQSRLGRVGMGKSKSMPMQTMAQRNQGGCQATLGDWESAAVQKQEQEQVRCQATVEYD